MAEAKESSKAKKQRQLFRQVSVQVKEIRVVNWINPIKPEETPIGWLNEGANLDYKRSITSGRLRQRLQARKRVIILLPRITQCSLQECLPKPYEGTFPTLLRLVINLHGFPVR
jgi:hypothetical protein